MSEYINIDINNIDNEHLCCAIADKKHQLGVECKKTWLKDRLNEGHVFRKLNEKGKVFIEYSPIESAWVPVIGNNYIYIYCLWVAGSFKGKNHGKNLLEYAIDDARRNNKSGLCVLSSKKKKPFLSEKSFFVKYGFKVVDTIDDYELLALSFDKNDPPKFNDTARLGTIDNPDLTIYYTMQCPYIQNCINEITEYCSTIKKNVNLIKVDSVEKAKNLPCVFNNWAVFYNKSYITNHLLNTSLLKKYLEKSK